MSDESALFHVARNGQVLGHLTEREIRDGMKQWTFSESDMGLAAGSKEWQPLRVLFPPEPEPAWVPPPLPQAVPTVLPPPLPAAQPKAGGRFAVAEPPRKKSRAGWWVAGGAALLLIYCGAVLLPPFLQGLNKREASAKARKDSQAGGAPIMEERRGHVPRWQKSSFEADGEAPEPPDGVFEKISYTSPAGKLVAYVTPDPKDGKKHPAVVWAHGGFGGIGSFLWEPAPRSNDQSARAFRERGIVLMCPSWRGENANPGRFEMFYGELNDYLAAIEHVKTLPYVDADRVYLAGHSTGGTTVLLAAVASDQFRAAFSFGGMTDCEALMAQGGYGNEPYSRASVKDNQLRSPVRYTAWIKRPTFYMEGGQSLYHAGARRMAGIAKTQGIPFQAFELPGDHFNILHPVTHLLAEKIAKDTGPECRVTLTQTELVTALKASAAAGLVQVLKEWRAAEDDLGERLKKAEEGQDEIQSVEDLGVAVDCIRKLTAQPVTPLRTGNLSQLAALGAAITDEERAEEFVRKGLPMLLAWGQAQLKAPPAAADALDAWMDFLDSISVFQDSKSAALVTEAVRRKSAPESEAWYSVFASYDKNHPQTGKVMGSFAADPPDGVIGLALLRAANNLSLNGWAGKHPYNCEKGAQLLEAWLKADAGATKGSHGFNAALGLAFVDAAVRTRLLPLGLAHPEREVQLEAAWADAKHHGATGLKMLKAACLDEKESILAQRYLREVGYEKEVPPAALEPKFQARAEMSKWLQHPNELGEAPATMEVYDQRKLYWPPAGESLTVTLLKFSYKSEEKTKTGYGMVGGMTWSSFKEYAQPPQPEALYLHHCTLETLHANEEPGSGKGPGDKEAQAEALKALREKNPGQFKDITVD